MFAVSQKIEYSIALVAYLAGRPNETVSLGEISRKLLLPYRFLGQLALPLKQAGIIVGKEGRSGGYCLGSGWEKKSIYNMLEALGENKHMVECLEDGVTCDRQTKCRFGRMWERIEARVTVELKALKLGEIKL